MIERTIAEIARDLEAGRVNGLFVGEPKRAGQEILRARHEEMRLTEALAEKDAQIKALADALELLRKTAHDDARRAEILPLVDNVLRLVGRLP